MGFTQDDLDAINSAIARGEKSVQFSDRSVTYRSLSELLQARKLIEDAISMDTPPRPRQFLGYSDKGF